MDLVMPQILFMLTNFTYACDVGPRLAGGGTITEHRAHGCLGLAWIWRVQQGVNTWQPLLAACLQDAPCLFWQEERVIKMIIIIRMHGLSSLAILPQVWDIGN